jgi:hypothetical protein
MVQYGVWKLDVTTRHEAVGPTLEGGGGGR